MKFVDLSENAKKKVRERWCETALDYNWWEPTYKEAGHIGAIMGIVVGERTARVPGFQSYQETNISFSGFCSQGDGCSWGGKLYTELFNGAEARIKEEAPTNEALHAIARSAQEIHNLLASHQVALRLNPPDEHGFVGSDFAYDECVPGVRVGIENREQYFSSRPYDGDGSTKFNDEFGALAESFASWIYKSLEAEHDYLLSDERIIEACEDYDENGDVV